VNTKKTLIALSAALALGILGASAALAGGDTQDGTDGDAQRDWVEWQRSLGHNPGNGYVDNGRSSYGFAAPHQPRKHIER
jgi:hypothetical protein